MFKVYLLYSVSHDSFYIGFTADMEKRLIQHNEGLTKSTKSKRPWKVVYTEDFISELEAIRRERFFKAQKNKSFYKKLSGLL
ncbi:MAG: GIY-YIG nuclease family protein [Bacteroidetes bacterium]|nr:GIY-YIG nuclease family protein [Bacteroidota bacterium]